jgi:excisionase family DNA binding protein
MMGASPDPYDRLGRVEELLGEVLGRLDNPQPVQRYLSVETAAAYCGISPESVRRLLSGGKLTALRPLKGRILIDRLQLDALVQASTVTPRRGRGRHREAVSR